MHGWWMHFKRNWAHLNACEFPPISLIGRVLAKKMGVKCTLIIVKPVQPSKPWYWELLCKIRFSFPRFQIFWPKTKPKPTSTPIMSESNTGFSNLEGLWQHYSSEGLSDQTNDLLESSRRLGTLYHYKTEWRKWVRRCISRKTDSVTAEVTFVLDFLSNLFSEGLGYRTINGYRSAISAYHEKVEGIPTGQHPKVCQFLNTKIYHNKGCFQGNWLYK